MQKINEEKIYRLIDANFNRAKEGLRVCEDVARFILNKKNLTRDYKTIRHKLEALLEKLAVSKESVLTTRDIRGDIGRKSISPELTRANVNDIFFANSQRVKESIRVLEEFAKLKSRHQAEDLKNIRYRLYALEKEIAKEF